MKSIWSLIIFSCIYSSCESSQNDVSSYQTENLEIANISTKIGADKRKNKHTFSTVPEGNVNIKISHEENTMNSKFSTYYFLIE
ncbi:hypothetical protein [Marivirga sp.]|uniref:hypothetical protein n=1 Tax=Marivirga sp. TaxID=2018662 RepID=UPI002D7F1AF2|nr:hypothetical protein [Marivirga sp.]HET8859018.1 hypothetical protein [Marivirga sp.]